MRALISILGTLCIWKISHKTLIDYVLLRDRSRFLGAWQPAASPIRSLEMFRRLPNRTETYSSKRSANLQVLYFLSNDAT
jgi:hypothetical protein